MFLIPSNKINHKKLLDNFDIIKDEYFSISKKDFFDYNDVRSGMDEMISNPKSTGTFWQVYPLINLMKPWPNRQSKTIDLLLDLGVIPLLSAFSILHPHSQIDPHEDHDESKVEDYSTTVVKYHLSIDIPSDGESGLVVGDESRILKNKDLNIFDESSTHWVYNRSSKVRGVLIISFLKKDLYE